MASIKPTRSLTSTRQVRSDENDNSTSMRGKDKQWSRLVLTVLTLLAINTASTIPTVRGKSSSQSSKVEIQGYDSLKTTRGAVASDDSRCSEAGATILKKGGHAVNAAIATCLCVGVVNPTESSIGGGSFMIVRDASTSKAVAFNMRETAPEAAHKNMYKNNPRAQFDGPLAMGVPGELKGLYEAWKMFGRLPWATLFEPSIQYARYGFEVYPYLARYSAEFEKKIMADPGMKSVFAPHGTLLKIGETCHNKKLADSLEAVAEHGPEVFYNGWLGENFVNDVRRAGGIVTMKDLKNYKVNVTDVLEVDFLGYRLLGMHPPSSGTVALAMVSKIFENYKSTAELEGPPGVHRLTEALKHVLANRMNLGDPAFDDISDVISKMTSSSFGKEIFRKINDTTTFYPEGYHSRWSMVEDHGTSHQSIVDAERNAVSLTSSINDHFGANMISPSTGILLNNQMGDFSIPTEHHPDHLPPATSNFIEPGKRPLSSMTPLIVLKGEKFVGVFGGTGGRNIAASVSQTLLNYLLFGMNPVDAVHTARVYPKLMDQDLDYENLVVYSGEHIELTQKTKIFLAERHHKMREIGFPAFCHIVVQNSGSSNLGRKVGDGNFGTVTAVSDIRKGARPAPGADPGCCFTLG